MLHLTVGISFGIARAPGDIFAQASQVPVDGHCYCAAVTDLHSHKFKVGTRIVRLVPYVRHSVQNAVTPPADCQALNNCTSRRTCCVAD